MQKNFRKTAKCYCLAGDVDLLGWSALRLDLEPLQGVVTLIGCPLKNTWYI